MILFDRSITRINECIKDRFPTGEVYPMCYQVKRNGELQIRQPKKGDIQKTSHIPALTGFEDTPVTVDDTFDLKCYHRITGNVQHELIKEYGRNKQYWMIADMSLIVSTRGRWVFEILQGILATFDVVQLADTDFDMYSIWNREWGTRAEDKINFENYLYSINYKLRAKATFCGTCPPEKTSDFFVFDDTFRPTFE